MMTVMQATENKKDDSNQTASSRRREKPVDNVHISPIAGFIGSLIYIAAILGAIIMDDNHAATWMQLTWAIGLMVVGTYIFFALKVAQQWEKAVVLRMGKFHALRGPGMFWMVPIVDATPVWIDHRVMVTPFNAEKTLTKDATQLID